MNVAVVVAITSTAVSLACALLAVYWQRQARQAAEQAEEDAHEAKAQASRAQVVAERLKAGRGV